MRERNPKGARVTGIGQPRVDAPQDALEVVNFGLGFLEAIAGGVGGLGEPSNRLLPVRDALGSGHRLREPAPELAGSRRTPGGLDGREQVGSTISGGKKIEVFGGLGAKGEALRLVEWERKLEMRELFNPLRA